MMVTCAYPQKAYGMLSIALLTPLSTAKLISIPLTRLSINPFHNGFPFPKKNSNKQSAIAMTHQHLDLTN